MESGQAVISDGLLRRLTSTSVYSEAADGEAAVTIARSPKMECIPASEVVEFGQDASAAALQNRAQIGTCGICFEEGVEVVSLCGDTSCSDRFCIACSGRHAETMVSSALYAMPWLKCPGCASRVQTQVWSGWVEPAVFTRYLGNGEALLNFRCPSCHDTGSLFRKCIPEHAPGFKLTDLEGLQGISDVTRGRLCDLWSRYSRAYCSAEEFVSELVLLLQGLEPGSAEADDANIEFEGAPPERLQMLMRPSGLPTLVADAERRCSMQLAFLRRFPKIRTLCCNAQMCFKCKVSGWHSGETCEFRQRKEVHKDLQFCPGCSVPTVKSEGCDHIVCVCGESWTWAPNPVWNLVRTTQIDVLRDMFADGFDANFSDEETGETLLHVAAEGGNIEVLSFLIEQGADVSRLDAAGSTILAAAVRRPYRQHTLDVLRALLDHQADVNASISPDGGFVITEALRTLAYGRAVDEDEDEREEAADAQRGVDLVEMLLSARASVAVRDEDLDGATPLLEAIRGGFDDIAAMLISAQVAQPDLMVPASAGSEVVTTLRALPGEDLRDVDNDSSVPPPPRQVESTEDYSKPQPPPLAPPCSSLEAADHSGNTPLYLAVSNRRHAVVAALLAARVLPDTRGPSATPPLHTAISNQDRESFNLLLAGRADANVTAEDGHLALHVALRALYRDASNVDAIIGDTWATCHRIVLRVIPLTNDLNAAAQDGQTPLGAAAANGSIDIMEVLLQHGALPDQGARGGMAPLSLAAHCGQADAVRLLLRSRADPCRVDKGGQTALHRLASNWLWQDTDPRRSDDPWVSCRGRKPLGRAETAQTLVEANADPNSLDIICRTPLLLASDPPAPVVVSKEQQAVVAALLTLRSNANLASSTGITPLIAAVQKDVEVVANQLLKHGVDTNSPEPLSGSRPLKIAVQRMHVGIVKSLVEHKSEVSSVDRSGQNAACAWVDSFASAYKAKRGPWAPKQRLFEEMLQALTNGNVQKAFSPCRGSPPLLAAWKQLDGLGQRSAIQMLLQARADPNSVDGSGRTLLHCICGNLVNHRSTVSLMELMQSVLQARADVIHESEDGETPLNLAANAGPAAQHAFKALLESLPERALRAPRWSRLLFRELEGGNEPVLTALVPRTGTMHFNDLGQGPMEVILGQSLLRDHAPWSAEAPDAEAQGVDPPDLEAQLRFAELLHKHGGVLPTPAWVWSKFWAAARASHALRRLEQLGDQGAKYLAELVIPGQDSPNESAWPAPLAGMLVATCVLVGLEPTPESAPASPSALLPASNSVVRFRPAVEQLLAGDGTMLIPRLACASSIEARCQTLLSPDTVRELRCFLEDASLSSAEVLRSVGGKAAVQLGMWVKAMFELAHVPRPVPVMLQAISQSIEKRFADRPDLRRRWLKVLLTSLIDVNAQDGVGNCAAHLALRSRDLGVGDAFLPLLQRGAVVDVADAAGTSVLDLLRVRALEALDCLPKPLDEDVGMSGVTMCAASSGSSSSLAEVLADAIAEVERCSLQLNLQEAASQQCLIVESTEAKLREIVAKVEAVRQDIEAEFSQAVPSMDQALEALDRLEYEEISRTSVLEEPPPALALVLAVACEILGKGKQHASSAKALCALPTTSWSHEVCMTYWPAAQKLLSAGLIIGQIHCHDKDSTSDECLELLRSLQVQLDTCYSGELQNSPTGSTIVLWMQALLAHQNISRLVKPKKEQLQELTQEMESHERHLCDELKHLQELQSAAEDASPSTSEFGYLTGVPAELKERGHTALAACGQAVRDALQLVSN
jgi:ankyrin repeat protein